MKKPKIGRPLKNPELGPRVAVTYRLPKTTVDLIRQLSRRHGIPQVDLIIAAVNCLVLTAADRPS